jgi:hypothetical protein
MAYEEEIAKRIQTVSWNSFLFLILLFILQMFGAITFDKFIESWFLFATLHATMDYVHTGHFNTEHYAL